MTATDELCRSEQAALRDQCSVFLAGDGPVSAAGLLADIPGDTAVDRYGDGGVVAELEAEIAGLLDKPAAAFLPSGTMAQQSVLRVHAERRQRRTVIFHPMCHLHRHEGQAFQRLHGLTGRPAGDPDRLMSIDDLTAVSEPPAALLIELPQRDLGGQQPDWADLQAQADWARGRAPPCTWTAPGYGSQPPDTAGRSRRSRPSSTPLRVLLQGPRRAGWLLPGRPGGRPRRGTGVAAPHGRHPVRALAERRLRAELPAAPAAADARVPQSCVRDRGGAPRPGGGPGRARPAPGPHDAPAAEHHPGALRGGGPPARRRAANLDLADRRADRRSGCAAGGTHRGRRHPGPVGRPGPRHHRRPHRPLTGFAAGGWSGSARRRDTRTVRR